MNEMTSPLRRRIDLRLEAPFQLGAFRVSPAALEVVGPNGASALEARVMQVLVALHRHRGETVSREELSDLCWEGRIVGDDALNRSISRLRKALAGDPGVSVDTIPKVGYRLRARPTAKDGVAETAGTERPSTVNPSRRVWWLAGGATAAVVLAVASATMFWPPAKWSAGAVRPLTRDAGVETDPALSPDGRFVAYAGGPGFGGERDIYLRGLSVGDAPPLRLTSGPADDMSPAWSPDGTRLAFSRQVTGQPCSLVVMSLPRGAERVVGRCRQDGAAFVSWLGNGQLVFGDRTAAGGPRRLYALAIDSGAVRPLTTPPAGAVGDAAPVPSPDGRLIAFRRTAALGADDLLVTDVRSGRERAVTTSGQKTGGYAWSRDSRSLFFTGNRAGDFGLWSVDLRRRAAPMRVSVGLVPLGRLSADGSQRLAAETFRTRGNLIAISASGAIETLTEPDGVVWDPDVAADGAVVYGSEASGSNQIWARRPGQAPARLTNLGGSYAHSPRWSPDGREIAFLGVVDGKTEVYVMQADGSRLRKVTADGRRKAAVTWAEGGLIYSERAGDAWRLMQMRGDAARPLAGGQGIAIVRRGPGGALYARRADDEALRVFDAASGRLTPVPGGPRAPDMEAWQPAADGVYWLRRTGGPGGASLWFTDWRGGQRQVAAFTATHRPNLAIRPSDGAVVVGQLRQDDIDLVMLDLKRD